VSVSIATLLGRLEKAGHAIETFLLVGMLTAMILLAVNQIVMREVFNITGFVWAEELIRLMVLWLALVGSIAAKADDLGIILIENCGRKIIGQACRGRRHQRCTAAERKRSRKNSQYSLHMTTDLFNGIWFRICAQIERCVPEWPVL